MVELRRRRMIQLGWAGIASAVGLSRTDLASAQESDVEVLITLDDQETQGSTLTIASIVSDVEANVRISENTPGPNETYARFSIDAGTDKQNFTVELDTPIAESQSIIARVSVPSEGGETVAKARAYATIVDEEGGSTPYGVSFIEANPDAGFQYPYFLFTPNPDETREDVPILVEPNNTGTSTDDFQLHKDRARKNAEAGVGAQISRELTVPLLVPVFPRPRSEPVDWTHYTHQLDRETLQISEGPLERIDLQLLQMVEDAKTQLSDAPYTFSEKIMLNGFSASGNFADRFAVLHADRVLSVTAGGLNGMALLPLESTEGHTLRYHVGIADVEELTGSTVDLDALDDVNQLLYMGEEDTNDTIPYDGPWTDEELKQTALDVYGDDMITERFPASYNAYEEAGISAQFKIYEDAGHTPSPAFEDLIEFHRRSLNGESVEEFGEALGPNLAFTVGSSNPDVDESVTFDASETQLDQGSIQAYTWEFGETGTASGEVVSHTFESDGEYEVTLTVVDSSGTKSALTKTVQVGSTGETAAATTTADPTETTDAEVNQTTTAVDATTETRAPGFGFGSVVGAVSALGIGAVLRRLRSE